MYCINKSTNELSTLTLLLVFSLSPANAVYPSNQ
jgi:hypothetical protein